MFVQHASKNFVNPIVWTGEPKSSYTVRELLSLRPSHPDVTMESLAFYSGDQWTEKEREKRKAAGLSSMVVNVIPAIVECYLCNSRKAGEEVTQEQEQQVIQIVVGANAAAQRLYNYQFSELVDRLKPVEVK